MAKRRPDKKLDFQGNHFGNVCKTEIELITVAYDNEKQSNTDVANIDESNEEKEPVSKKILIQK